MEGFVKQIRQGGWEAERQGWGWRNREGARSAGKKARQAQREEGREKMERGRRERRVRRNVEREKRVLFVSQPCSLWLLSIQCTFTKGERGEGRGEAAVGWVWVIDIGWRSGNEQSGVSPAARSEPHAPLHNTARAWPAFETFLMCFLVLV